MCGIISLLYHLSYVFDVDLWLFRSFEFLHHTIFVVMKSKFNSSKNYHDDVIYASL